MHADDPPSIFSPLTLVVQAARLSARLGLFVSGGKLLGPLAAKSTFLRPSFGDFAPGPKDVVVATFPKSGTNLTLQIAHQIAGRGAAEFVHVHDVTPWPDAPSEKVVALGDAPPTATGHQIIKTHLTAEFTPHGGEGLTLAILRDPKEVAVSAYYFALGLLDVLDRVTIDDYLELFLADAMPFGSWASHTHGWWEARTQPGVELFNFRTMKRDLPGQVDRIAALMGVELTSDERAAVIERAGLPWMKAHERQFRPPPLPSIKPRSRPKMVRSGKSGGSGELLSLEQQRAIDAHAMAGLKALGSDFPYAEWFDLS